jgi:phenylalanyl-tRNA synthetase beta chain
VHYQGKVIGWLGQLHPQIAKALDLPTSWVAQLNLQAVIDMHQQALTIMTPSKFPQVRRDIAVVVDKSIAMQSMKDTIKQVGGELLKDVWLFDVYAGSNVPESQQSLAFALVWQDIEATLSDERINAQMEAVIAALHEQYHATLRM